MSIDNISSELESDSISAYNSLGLKLAQQQSSSVSTLLGSMKSSSTVSSLINSWASGTSDLASISAISTALQEVSKAADASGVSDVMPNVQQFVSDLRSKGTDASSILLYLNRAKELAKSDPEYFAQVFGAADDADTDAVTEESEAVSETTESEGTETGAEESTDAES